MMDVSEMRECPERQTAVASKDGFLGRTFTAQSTSELRASLLFQALPFLLYAASRIRRASTKILWRFSDRAGRHTKNLEERTLSLSMLPTTRRPCRTHFAQELPPPTVPGRPRGGPLQRRHVRRKGYGVAQVLSSSMRDQYQTQCDISLDSQRRTACSFPSL
ncbi:hypothetical protein ARMSODRAFT_118180 [Armillaria solidipes]|uniref:Uncharacterized protein n=1 Tax=Armillaria solidipes TaxID=1076256 RepID=A0A2H3B653_9AGAR|nr:hypothetical protein ARMSODRAFT_118180 [Armillaria solidipes]